MAMLPIQESYAVDLTTAADLDLIVPAAQRRGAVSARPSPRPRSTCVDIMVETGCVDATAEILETVRGLGVPIEFMSRQTRWKGLR